MMSTISTAFFFRPFQQSFLPDCYSFLLNLLSAFDRHFLGNDIRVFVVLGREQTREGFGAVIERFAEFLLALEMPLTETTEQCVFWTDHTRNFPHECHIDVATVPLSRHLCGKLLQDEDRNIQRAMNAYQLINGHGIQHNIIKYNRTGLSS
jgi:hypothetical protein